uniref:[acyl-carrier-protein] S-malonyltransferase n=1 Tax=mine drainage metagenome TaxID=410659 RepID=E6Q0B9_9ZZZZ
MAAATLAEADEALGFSLSRIFLDGPEDELRLTENTQPAILTVSVAAWRVLAEHGVQPAFAAGHSLGEWSAHVAAGTFSFADAVRAVKARGRSMQLAVPAGEGAMAAVLALGADEVSAACDEAARMTGKVVSAANFNSPDQTVISGAREAVEKAGELAKERGARRVVPLPVSAPFHCALMEPARLEVERVLSAISLSEPRFPVAANVSGGLLMTVAAVREALVEQVTGTVRWVACVKALKSAGAEVFVEVGPGKVLSGLLRQIDHSQKCLNVDDPASLEKTLAELG